MRHKTAKTEDQTNSVYLHLITCGRGERAEWIHAGGSKLTKGDLGDAAPPTHAIIAECGLEYYYLVLYRKCLPNPSTCCGVSMGLGVTGAGEVGWETEVRLTEGQHIQYGLNSCRHAGVCVCVHVHTERTHGMMATGIQTCRR